MREPLPVQIVNQPDTNLLLELANGLIGAVVGAAAAALVAFLVVRRAQEADRTIARELAAYAAAEELTDSVIRTWRTVSRMAGRYEEEDLRRREDVHEEWRHLAILKSPPLTEWTSLKPIYEYQQALKALGGDVRLRWDEVPKVEDPYGDPIIDREQLGQLRAAELAQLEICRATSKAVADSLTSFRAQGRNNPPRKRTWNLRLSGRSNSD